MAFRTIDKENQGYITDKDMLGLLQKKGYKEAMKEVNRVFLNLGIHNRQINYSQFLAATLDTRFFMKRENLWNIFKHFDTDDTNSISINNIQEILARNGRQVKEQEMADMIQEFDLDKDGMVCFEEFCAMIQKEHSCQSIK